MFFWWLFTVMNEQKKVELRNNSETIENNDIEEVIEELK
jgi:hypothetical protein